MQDEDFEARLREVEKDVAVVRADLLNISTDVKDMKVWIRWGVGLAAMVLVGLAGLFFQYQQLAASAAALHR